jgi:hypothetical protein
MNKFIKALIDKFNKQFTQEFKRQKQFFSKPDVLIALGVTSLALLNKFAQSKKNKDEIKQFINGSPQIKSILNFTSTNVDDDNLNDLLKVCLTGDTSLLPVLPDDLSSSDFISLATSANDIDSKIDYNKLNQLTLKFENTTIMILSFSYLFAHIITISKDLFATEFPSKYRTKHTQKLTRNTYGLLKQQIKNVSKAEAKQINELLAGLLTIDNILIAITIASVIYIANRKILQNKSYETLQKIASENVCIDLTPAFDVSVNKIPFQISLNCPAIIDDVQVPHEPIELKLQNPISCEVNQNNETATNATQSQDLATFAIIRNTSKSIFVPVVVPDAFVTQDKRIATFAGKALFSPVTGTVDQISVNEVILRDISDQDNYLQDQVDLLNTDYQRLNYVNAFLKDYYIESLYPVLLNVSVTDDASTHATKNLAVGVNNLFDIMNKAFSNINKNYEKQIKNITGKDNVEKNAKNETLDVIKTQLDDVATLFYKNEQLMANQGLNDAKAVLAKPDEFILFDYYTLNIGNILHGLANPTPIEIAYTNIIDDIIRKRFVIDNYSKTKLATKINNEVQLIVNAPPNINWLSQMSGIYNTHKSSDDVKTWLTGLADKNKKLGVDQKISEVNKAMFLFKLYLDADKLVEKYTILKKESNPLLETVKEGNAISTFFGDLWKERVSLPVEITRIQDLIDSLNTFSTYSISEYNGEQARLYILADEPACQSPETDPRLNPKSKYGYGDIQYWLRYCSLATLASVTNPATGWATGWIIPTPIPFPVVYIPFKSIPTKYGFFVIGLTVCGIWIFPWTLFVNMTSNYHTPSLDPTNLLKQNIEVLKKSISTNIKNLKKTFIKKSLDDNNAKIAVVQTNLTTSQNQLKDNKAVKPKKYLDNGSKNKLYTQRLTTWTENNLTLNETILTLKTKKYELEKISAVLSNALKSGSSTKDVNPALEQSEKQINKQLANLSTMVDNVDKTLAPLPIAMTPNTANFGITLKNTKPIIKIAGELDDNVNESAVDSITKNFKLQNAPMMSTNYKSTLLNNVLNYNAYKKTLSGGMNTMISKDPFPKYELLSPINIPYITFLYKDFVTKGAQCYGFPGQLPLPI